MGGVIPDLLPFGRERGMSLAGSGFRVVPGPRSVWGEVLGPVKAGEAMSGPCPLPVRGRGPGPSAGVGQGMF